jgi:hypothetical protein
LAGSVLIWILVLIGVLVSGFIQPLEAHAARVILSPKSSTSVNAALVPIIHEAKAGELAGIVSLPVLTKGSEDAKLHRLFLSDNNIYRLPLSSDDAEHPKGILLVTIWGKAWHQFDQLIDSMRKYCEIALNHLGSAAASVGDGETNAPRAIIFGPKNAIFFNHLPGNHGDSADGKFRALRCNQGSSGQFNDLPSSLSGFFGFPSLFGDVKGRNECNEPQEPIGPLNACMPLWRFTMGGCALFWGHILQAVAKAA